MFASLSKPFQLTDNYHIIAMLRRGWSSTCICCMHSSVLDLFVVFKRSQGVPPICRLRSSHCSLCSIDANEPAFTTHSFGCFVSNDDPTPPCHALPAPVRLRNSYAPWYRPCINGGEQGRARSAEDGARARAVGHHCQVRTQAHHEGTSTARHERPPRLQSRCHEAMPSPPPGGHAYIGVHRHLSKP